MNLLILAIAAIITLTLLFIFESKIKYKLEEEKYRRKQFEQILDRFHYEFMEHIHKYH